MNGYLHTRLRTDSARGTEAPYSAPFNSKTVDNIGPLKLGVQGKTMEKGNRPRKIPLRLLLPHPENTNLMNTETLRKLRRHVERTGRYEPLTTRPHPSEQGKFEIINGHNRLRVLRALDYKEAYCLVWDVADDEARLFLATFNALAGSDVQERRAVLVESLLARYGVDELTRLLPEDRKRIETLERLAKVELDEPRARQRSKEASEVPIIVSMMLGEAEAKDVNLALDLILCTSDEKLSRGQAMAMVARSYIKTATGREHV